MDGQTARSAEYGRTMSRGEKLPRREASGEVVYELGAFLRGGSVVASGSLHENGETAHAVVVKVEMIVE